MISFLLLFAFEQTEAKSSVQTNLVEHSQELFVDDPAEDSNENLEKIHFAASCVQNIDTLSQSYSYLSLKSSEKKTQILKPPDSYLFS